ncbi:GSCOCG00004868001-RA-CDS [Cotesia congregata]|nr:GSCOCG00004868001-RA-CDS [Cotesia congregata]
MTSEYWLTKNKFNLNIFALQNLKFNSGLIGDVNILNCDNIIKTDQLKIFDEMLASKNIVAMYNPNYKSLNKLQRQSLVEKNDQLTSEMINKYEVEFNETNNHFQHLVRTHLTDSLELIKPVNFIPSSESKMTKPTKAIISFERSMNDSIVLRNTLNSFMIFELLIIPFIKVYFFSDWIQNIFKKACKKVYYSLFNSEIQIYPKTEVRLPHKQITKSNRMLSLLIEKFDRMNQEIFEIRAASETTFSSLVNEVQSLKISNKKISDDNDALVKELKKLSQMLEVVQFNSKIAEKQASGGIPPPPPPPPPPLPLSSQKTPKNNKMHTPRKSSIPQIEKRPVITMDDLLKVTLRKAPKIDKEKPKAASDPQPVISLEMLKNVKLKSIKQRSQNYKVRSPIGLKNRNRFQNVNLSPIMAGAVSPLSRILSRGESVRRKPRKILVSPREDEETH